MQRKTSSLSRSVLAAACTLLLSAGAAQAQQDTLAKIKNTQTVTMGVREASGAMSFTTGNGKYAGFHVEVCERALRGVQKELGLPKLDIQYQMVTAQNRMPLITNGTVDVECGTTTNNVARQKDVAFAPTLYMEEVRTAVAKNSGITSQDQLAGKSVAVTAGATSVPLLRKYAKDKQLEINVLVAKDNAECFILLESDRAQACVADGQILATGIARMRDPGKFHIVGAPFSVEPLAIMLNKESPAFKKMFDAQIASLSSNGELAKIYDKWFMQPIPPNGITVNLPASDNTKAAWKNLTDKPMEAYQTAQQ